MINGANTTDAGGNDIGNIILQQADGKIIVAGASDTNVVLIRYNTNGTLDKSFGDNGKVDIISTHW